MKEIDLEQGSNIWKDERHKYIGSSDVAVILGVSPWNTPLQLWEEKTGRIKGQDSNWIFEKGHRLEAKARGLFEFKYGISIPPKVIQREDTPFCRVSLDGLNIDRNTLVEIKYVGKDAFTALSKDTDIPAHYYPQVQYQMYATGIKKCLFTAITDNRNDIVVIPVNADLDYIEKLINACRKFYQHMITDTPPDLTTKDFAKVDNNDLENLINTYQLIKKDVETKDKQLKSVKAKISKLMTHNRMVYNNIKLTKTIVKGTYDYKAISKFADVDKEKYLRPDSERFTITIGKRKE